ncbi:MAG: AMP-binding protein [Deltaproteobacteria bacterium]|nr:AMP-binding protein [Deltaproteobacteria bacterium]
MEQWTLPKVFYEQLNRLRNRTFLIHKKDGEWQNVSWAEVGDKVRNLSLGLMKLGVKKGDRISVISETRPDYAYTVTDIANTGAIFTGIYQTNSPKECAHVINDSGAKVVFAENRAQCEKILKAAETCPHLEKIIVFDGFSPVEDPRVMTLSALYALGRAEYEKNGEKEYLERLHDVKPEDVTAIIYTSGTTGPPKGVMDTNRGILMNLREYTKFFPVDETDRGLSFLPMAHALELRNGHWFHINFGIEQVYAEGMRQLFDNVREMNPTFFFTTPRFFEKHYNIISAEIEKASRFRKKVIKWCLKAGARYNDDSWNVKGRNPDIFASLSYALAKKLFINAVREKVGRKLRYGGVGGAPMTAEMLNFFRACGVPLYEGYGLTEGCGQLAVNRPGVFKFGTVGKPLDGIEVKIRDDGEIIARGWLCTPGYWNNSKATGELYEGDWLNTGDIGAFDEDGFLKITGRKKEILITSGGKNVSPSYIENILKLSPYISQAVVFGEGKDYLVALLTLNQEEVKRYAEKNGIAYRDYAELITKKDILDLIQREVDYQNRDVAKVEQIKRFTILKDEFSQEREEVTPTFKIKRNIITERYRDVVAGMYE